MTRVFALLLLFACGPAPVEPDTYVPFATHFANYTKWESFTIPGGAAQDMSHLAGDRTVYVNKKPGRGAAKFGVGTLIVKTTADQIFVMAKRGGGYNPDGAVDWEWLELEGTVDQPFIRWRGIGPPDGEGYGQPGTSGCNICHSGAAANDFVHSAQLQLSGF